MILLIILYDIIIIVQVFDKAVDEASYSSMYAQLCVRLNEVAPNFEEPSSSTTVSDHRTNDVIMYKSCDHICINNHVCHTDRV